MAEPLDLEFSLAILPPWPPDSVRSSEIGSWEGVAIRVELHPDGRIVVTARVAGDSRMFPFQPIAPMSFGYAFLRLKWMGEHAVLNAAGHELVPDPLSDQPTFFLNCRPVTHSPLLDEIAGSLQTNPPFDDLSAEQYFFFETLNDLRTRLEAGTAYDLLRAAGLLRQLLLDPVPLYQRVNVQAKVKLRFWWVAPSATAPDYADVALAQSALDPRHFPERIKCGSLKNFLSTDVLHVDGLSFSVRDVISTCANAKGGIHFGPPKKPSEVPILNMDGEMLLGLQEPSLFAMKEICVVAIHGLTRFGAEIMPKVDA